MSRHRERDDDYQHTIYQVDDRHRVSVCAEGIQYLIQYRAGKTDNWIGRKYFSDLKGIERGLKDLNLPLDGWLGHIAKAK